MGTLDQTINIINKNLTQDTSLDFAKEAELKNNYNECIKYIIESIETNKNILSEKPQNQAARQQIIDALDMLSTLNAKDEQFNLTHVSPPLQKKYQLAHQIFSFFKEKNWESQCEGKFGGPKPDTETWKSFYTKNEETMNSFKKNENKISWAIENGHHQIVSNLIKKHRSYINKNAALLLESSIKKNFSKITKLLIEHGASVNTYDHNKWTPLHWACLTNNKDIIHYLITNKAKINAKTKEALMPIHIACIKGNLDLIELLIKHKSHLNVKEKTYKLTPIQLAAKNHHLDCVNKLIDLKVNINVQDITGKSLMHWAAIHDYHHILEKLLAQTKQKINCDIIGRLPIHWAAQFNAIDCIKLLIQNQHALNEEDMFKDRPLLIAAFFKQTNTFSLLFENGAR